MSADDAPMTATEARRRNVIYYDADHPEYPDWKRKLDVIIRAREDTFLAPITERTLRIIAAQELRRYLRAVSPDLPLPRDATGWWVRREWRMRLPPWVNNPVARYGEIATVRTSRWVYRWQPFGGAA